MKGFPRPSHICVILLFLVSQVLCCPLFVVVIWLLLKSQYIINIYVSQANVCVFISPVVSGGCHHHRNPSSRISPQLLGATQGAETVTHPDWRHYYGRSLRESRTDCGTKRFQDLLILCYVSMLFFQLQHRCDISSPFPLGGESGTEKCHYSVGHYKSSIRSSFEINLLQCSWYLYAHGFAVGRYG